MNILETDPSQKLYNLIFNLPQQHSEIISIRRLSEELNSIKDQMKLLKKQNRIQDIQKKCYKNQRLIFISKLLKENYFKINPVKEIDQLLLSQPLDLDKYQSTQSNIVLSQSSSYGYSQFQTTLHGSRQMPSQDENRLKLLLISMFSNMLVNEKMINFINSMNIPLYIYIMLLKNFILASSSHKTDNEQLKLEYLKKKQTEKCLKFIYQYIKVSKEEIPKLMVFLIKNMLQEYQKDYEQDITDENLLSKKQRIKLCYSYIFETGLLILKKNVFLASKCGILSLLFNKCIDGKLTIHKVQIITDIIINYCIEEKTRYMIHHTIDLGKTFAIFTNVDMVQSTHEKIEFYKNESKVSKGFMQDKDRITCCAIMIEMYLNNWPTLIYFLHEKQTLHNFIISLKRKESEELKMLNEILFKKIMKRCINLNTKKIQKSNNIFNIESNYLILKSYIILHYFYSKQEFKELIYNNKIQLKQEFIEIFLDFFINKQEKDNQDINFLLIDNIQNIKYYKKNSVRIQKMKFNDNEIITNNIQSYYSETLLSFQFNMQEFKYYLAKVSSILSIEFNKGRIQEIFDAIKDNHYKEKIDNRLLLQFYNVCLECSKEIAWLDQYLDISKFLSNILRYLKQSKDIQEINEINEVCRKYTKDLFQCQKRNYFQVLNINLLDDIGKYFNSDNKIIEYVQKFMGDIDHAYKISRIVLQFDFEHNRLGINDSHPEIIKQICRSGSKALILQIIQIMKYYCEQNDNRFLKEHLQIIFTLIYNNDEDIVYSIVELLEQFVNKSKELKEYILKIDIKRIKHWNKRILYLLLHDQSAIKAIKQSSNSTFLNDELEKWENGENRKKIYYNFLYKQLRKFSYNSIVSTEYLNLNMDTQNYRKLIFLPWNTKINEQHYPVFIEYKTLQDKLKLKIYLNKSITKDIVIEQLYVGSHTYTKYIEVKSIFGKKAEDLRIRLNLEEIKKEFNLKGKEGIILGKQTNRFCIQKQETFFYIIYEDNQFKMDKIILSISLTLDTYRPLAHPFNYINLLCRTKFGFEFLKKQKFISNCLQIISKQENFLPATNKQELKGSLVCIGTLCASNFMQIDQKMDIKNRIIKIFQEVKNYEIQQICLWILNIVFQDQLIRSKTTKNTFFKFIQTKKCRWLCIPQISSLNKEKYNIDDRISNSIKYLRQNLPQKLSKFPPIKASNYYKYLCDILNENIKEEQKMLIESHMVQSKLLENIIKYMSIIDFAPSKIYFVFHKLSEYMLSKQFQSEYSNAIILP